MGRIAKISKSIRQPDFGNWKAVVLAVVAATTFWFFHSLNQNYTSSITYPIQFEYPEDNYIVTRDLPTSIQINVTGIGWNIFRKSLALNKPPVFIPLENPAEVKKIVGAGLLPQVNDQLDDIRVNYIITDTLYISVENMKSRKLAINVDSATISLKTNFRIVSHVVPTPDSILITGPQSIIDNLPASLPMAVGEQNIEDDFDEFVLFKIRGYSQPLLTATPEEVNVQFYVEEFETITRNLTVELINFPEDESVVMDDSITTVTMIMATKDVDQLIADSIHVEVDYLKLDLADSTIVPTIISYPEIISTITTDNTGLKVRYE